MLVVHYFGVGAIIASWWRVFEHRAYDFRMVVAVVARRERGYQRIYQLAGLPVAFVLLLPGVFTIEPIDDRRRVFKRLAHGLHVVVVVPVRQYRGFGEIRRLVRVLAVDYVRVLPDFCSSVLYEVDTLQIGRASCLPHTISPR